MPWRAYRARGLSDPGMTRIEPPDWRAMVRARLDAESLRPEIVEECVEELAQHLEAAYQDLRARGVSPDQSRDDLVGQLESAELMEMVSARSRLQSQPTPGLPARRRLPALAGDLRYAARSLRRVPMLTTVIVLSLGIVIGANTAIFGLVESLILRRLPIPRADELVAPCVFARPAALLRLPSAADRSRDACRNCTGSSRRPSERELIRSTCGLIWSPAVS